MAKGILERIKDINRLAELIPKWYFDSSILVSRIRIKWNNLKKRRKLLLSIAFRHSINRVGFNSTDVLHKNIISSSLTSIRTYSTSQLNYCSSISEANGAPASLAFELHSASFWMALVAEVVVVADYSFCSIAVAASHQQLLVLGAHFHSNLVSFFFLFFSV